LPAAFPSGRALIFLFSGKIGRNGAERYSGESRGRIEGLLGELEEAVSGRGGGEP